MRDQVAPIPRRADPKRNGGPKIEPEPGESEAEVGILATTEPVTVRLPCEVRDRAGRLAALLQRKRSEKSHRFTANSVYRVAIDLFLEKVALGEGPGPNTEEELKQLARKLLRSR